MGDTCLLGAIPIRQLHIWKHRFGLFIDAPPDHAHMGRITKTPGPTLYLVLLVRSMNVIVARLTEGDQIVRAVTTGLARLDMMDIQDGIVRFPLTPLTGGDIMH